MSARGCQHCGGIYLHYGMCPHIPADTPAGRERDRKLAERAARKEGEALLEKGANFH